MKTDTKTLAAGLRIAAKAQLEFSSARDAINLAADRLEELERELVAAKEGAAKEISRLNRDVSRQSEQAERHRAERLAERALADRLANSMFGCPSTECDNALADWKQARGKEA